MATPATINEINGAYPSIDVAGSGTSAAPWDLSLNANWAAEVADRVASPWTLFTPTWNNVTIGDATNGGDYRYVNGDMLVRVHMIFGSSTVFTGAVSFDLPDSQTSKASGAESVGVGSVKDGTTDAVAHCRVNLSATSVTCFSATDNITATNPFTWAVGDDLYMQVLVSL